MLQLALEQCLTHYYFMFQQSYVLIYSVVALGQTAPEVHIVFSSVFNAWSQYIALYCAHVATEKITLTSDIELCIWKKEIKVICWYFWWICLFLYFKYIDCHHPLSSGPVTHEKWHANIHTRNTFARSTMSPCVIQTGTNIDNIQHIYKKKYTGRWYEKSCQWYKVHNSV